MPLSSHVSADVFLHIPTSLTAASPLQPVVVFFITGNPGLIGYYHPFLSLVVEGLKERAKVIPGDRGRSVVIAGFSLGGFDVERCRGRRAKQRPLDLKATQDGDASESAADRFVRELSYPPSASSLESCQRKTKTCDDGKMKDDIYSLRDQIELCYTRIEYLVQRLRQEYPAAFSVPLHPQRAQCGRIEPVDIILMGHSVGAYISLEIVRLWHERHPGPPLPSSTSMSPTIPVHSQNQFSAPPWRVKSCILLTPTIIDLHLSSSGRLATPLLTSVPLFSNLLPTVLHSFLHSILLRTLPEKWFESLVSCLTGMKQASHGLESTIAFLKSRRGVKQALYMASRELKEIRADQWGTEVWGSNGARKTSIEGIYGGESPKIYLWFAKADHWVADSTRDEILNKRGTRFVKDDGVDDDRLRGMDVSNKHGTMNTNAPTIRIDMTNGLIHAWCLAQSDILARQVGNWLDKILEEHDVC